MSKNVLLTLLGTIVVVGVVAIVAVKGKSNDAVIKPVDTSSETSDTTSNTAKFGNEEVFEGTFADLAKRGGDYKCDMSHTSQAGDSVGVVYISDDKIRTDFKTIVSVAGGMNIESHMISDGEFVYVWSSMMPQGFKMKTTLTSSDLENIPMSNQVVDANQSYSYSCIKSKSDSSLFVAPSSVEFRSM